MRDIGGQVRRLWIAMLNHPLGDDEYASVLISGLAVLGIREDDGWLGAEDYTQKYSAVVKLSRLIVVEHAYHQRQDEIRKHQAKGWSPSRAQQEATSHVERVRSMVSGFMTQTHDQQRTPKPMSWIYDARSYGLKIRYTTPAEGKVAWIEGDLLYGQMRFSMDAFRRMVMGLVQEAQTIMFERLMMVPWDRFGGIEDVKARGGVPPIPWETLVDHPSEARVGWSFLDDTRHVWPVDGQQWLYMRVQEERSLHDELMDERDEWRRDRLVAYQQAVERWLEVLWMLMMMLSQPPRAPPSCLGCDGRTPTMASAIFSWRMG